MSKDNLSIDIYHENYPKPVLMNNSHVYWLFKNQFLLKK